MEQTAGQSGSGRSIIISALSAQFESTVVAKPGKLDPYFELELSGTKVQTKNLKGAGLNPQWDPSDGWRLHDQGGAPYLIVRGFTKHTLGKDTSLGEGQLALEELFTSSDTQKEIPLADAKGKTGVFMFTVREHLDQNTETSNQGVSGPQAAGAAGAGDVGPRAGFGDNGQTAHLRDGQVVNAYAIGSEGRSVRNLRQDEGLAAGALAGGAAGGAAYGAQAAGPDNTAYGAQATGPGGAAYGAQAGGRGGELSEADKLAQKHELVPQELVAAVGEHIAPEQQHGREIETVAGQGSTFNRNQGTGSAAGMGGMGSSYDNQGSGSAGGMGGERNYSTNQGTGSAGGMGGMGSDRSYSDNQGTSNAGAMGMGGIAGAMGGMAAGAMAGNRNQSNDQGTGSAGGMGGDRGGDFDGQRGMGAGAGGFGAGAAGADSGPGQEHSESSSQQYDPSKGTVTTENNTTTQTDSKNKSNTTTTTGPEGGYDAKGQPVGGMVEDEHTHEENYDKKETTSETTNTFDTRGMERSEEHWQKAEDATHQAREQARLVEQAAIKTTEIAHTLDESQREADFARRKHLEMQERLAALDLNAKKSALEHAKELFEAEQERLNPLIAGAQESQQRAAGLDQAVHNKGAVLQSAVEETEAHKRRLAEVAAMLAAAQGAAAEAETRHREHLAALALFREQHDRSLTEAQRLEAELADIREKRAELEALETRHVQTLGAVRATQQEHAAKIAQLEPVLAQSAQQIQGTRGQLAQLATAHGSEQQAVAEQRAEVERMNKETLALMEDAKREKEAADAQYQELMAAQEKAMEQQENMMARQQSMQAIESEHANLQSEVETRESTVKEATHHVEELQRQLLVSKQRVDLAQARKEELWDLAKKHGEDADKATDAHFLQAAEAHKQLLGDTPGGFDPNELVTKGDLTEKIATTEATADDLKRED